MSSCHLQISQVFCTASSSPHDPYSILSALSCVHSLTQPPLPSEVSDLALLCSFLPMHYTLFTGCAWQYHSLAHSLHSSVQRNRRTAGASTGVGAGWGICQGSGLLPESADFQQQHPDGEVFAEGMVSFIRSTIWEDSHNLQGTREDLHAPVTVGTESI